MSIGPCIMINLDHVLLRSNSYQSLGDGHPEYSGIHFLLLIPLQYSDTIPPMYAMLLGRLTLPSQDCIGTQNKSIDGQHDCSVELKNSYEIGGSSGLPSVVETDSVIRPGYC